MKKKRQQKRVDIEHTFEAVDSKVAETEFFLRKMARPDEPTSFHYCLSAFLSASRTTTLALQQLRRLPGFDAWYEPHRAKLKRDSLAKFFLDARNAHVHGGPHPVTSWYRYQDESLFFFDRGANPPGGRDKDVLTMCRDFFLTLLEVVYDCYAVLGVHIDPQQYFTKEHFATLGRSVDDAEVELFGWVCTSLIDEGFDEDDRWHELRGNAGECLINHLFYGYLGKPTPQPLVPDYIADFDYEPGDRGWTHVPAGFETVEAYQAYREQRGLRSALGGLGQ